MSFTIEDVLRGHGLGVGGGTEVISSDIEPKTGLREGLLWYNTSTKQIKMYVGGSFQSLGSGGNILTTLTNRVETSTNSNSVDVGINYNAKHDILMVFQGGTRINRGTEYIVSEDGKFIQKPNGTWPSGVLFDFVVIAVTSIPTTDTLMLAEFKSRVVVPVDKTTRIIFDIPEFNSSTDNLQVYQEEVRIHEGTHWELAPNGQSINLIGYSANAGDTFYFYILKKIRDNVPEGIIDGVTQLMDNSVSKSKLEISVQENLSEFDEHKVDVVKHFNYAVADGTNNYTTTASDIKELVEGLSLKIKFSNANTGASTLNINSLGAKSIRKGNGNTLSSGNVKSGQICHLVYTGSVFQLLGEGGEYGTAVAEDVYVGKTFGADSGLVTGINPYKSGVVITDNHLNKIESPGKIIRSDTIASSGQIVIDKFDNTFLVYLIGSTFYVKKYNKDNEQVWQTTFNSLFTSVVTFGTIKTDGENLYIYYYASSTNDYSYVAKFDQTGSIIFNVKVSDATSNQGTGTPSGFLLFKDQFIIFSKVGSGGFFRYFRLDGTFKWASSTNAFDFPISNVYLSGSDDSYVYIVNTSDELTALNKDTLAKLWESPTIFPQSKEIYSNANGIYIFSSSGSLYKLNKSTGSLVSQIYRSGSNCYFTNTRIVLFISNTIELYDYDLNLVATFSANFSGAADISSEGYLYISATDNTLKKVAALNKYLLV